MHLWNSPAWLLTWLAASLVCYGLEEAALHLSKILHPSSSHLLSTVLPSSYLPRPKHCFAYLLIVVCPYLKDTQQHEGVYHGSYCDCKACGGPGKYTADFQNLCVERQRKEALSRLSLLVVAGMSGPRPGPDLCGAHMFAPGALLSI